MATSGQVELSMQMTGVSVEEGSTAEAKYLVSMAVAAAANVPVSSVTITGVQQLTTRRRALAAAQTVLVYNFLITTPTFSEAALIQNQVNAASQLFVSKVLADLTVANAAVFGTAQVSALQAETVVLIPSFSPSPSPQPAKAVITEPWFVALVTGGGVLVLIIIFVVAVFIVRSSALKGKNGTKSASVAPAPVEESRVEVDSAASKAEDPLSQSLRMGTSVKVLDASGRIESMRLSPWADRPGSQPLVMDSGMSPTRRMIGMTSRFLSPDAMSNRFATNKILYEEVEPGVMAPVAVATSDPTNSSSPTYLAAQTMTRNNLVGSVVGGVGNTGFRPGLRAPPVLGRSPASSDHLPPLTLPRRTPSAAIAARNADLDAALGRTNTEDDIARVLGGANKMGPSASVRHAMANASPVYGFGVGRVTTADSTMPSNTESSSDFASNPSNRGARRSEDALDAAADSIVRGLLGETDAWANNRPRAPGSQASVRQILRSLPSASEVDAMLADLERGPGFRSASRNIMGSPVRASVSSADSTALNIGGTSGVASLNRNRPAPFVLSTDSRRV